MRKTDVYLREFNEYKSVNISSDSKPRVNENIQKKWQNIINIVADVMNVPAGLIMKITETDMEIFLKSSNPENPYPENGKDRLGHGLYCETVIGTDQSFIVEDALIDERWKNNPDVALDMISYFGVPIKWHDGEMFGTICVLNNKSQQYTAKHQKLLKLFNEAIESDLYNLELIANLEKISKTDDLTQMSNRRNILNQLEITLNNYHQRRVPFFCIMIDLDNFKQVNDLYGHETGDDVLIAFSKILKKGLRANDLVGRLGGDEFLVILVDAIQNDVNLFIQKILEYIEADRMLKKYDISISYGVAEVEPKNQKIKSIIKEADDQLLKKKTIKRLQR